MAAPTLSELTESLGNARASLTRANAKRRELLEKYKGTTTGKVGAALVGGALVPIIETVLTRTIAMEPMTRSLVIAGGASLMVAWNEEGGMVDYAMMGALGKVGGDLTEDAMGAILAPAKVASADLPFKPAAITRRTDATQQVQVLAGGRGAQALLPRSRAGSRTVQEMASSRAFQGLSL